MPYVISYAVLVNGQPIKFFKSSRGLRQGSTLSLLLFLLIVEGLSRLINKAKEEGKLVGIKISMVLRISQLFFVGDILLFGKGTLEEWHVLEEILETFSSATCMDVSETKSTFLEYGMEEYLLS